MISWEDFENVNIQTGTIVEVNDFPTARKPAYHLKIDFGASGHKTVFGTNYKALFERAIAGPTSSRDHQFSNQANCKCI